MTDRIALSLDQPRRPWRGYVYAAVSAAVALSITMFVWPAVPNSAGRIEPAPFLLSTIAVITTAWFYGRFPGILATMLAALGHAVLLSPSNSLWIDHELDMLRWIIFIFTGLVVSAMAGARLRAEENLAFVAKAGTTLASSLDLQTVLDRSASMVIPRLGDLCLVCLVNDKSQVERVAAAHGDSTKQELARKLCFHTPNLVKDEMLARALRSGSTELSNHVSDTDLITRTDSPEELRTLRELNIKRRLIVPLLARGRIVGALSIARCQKSRPFTTSEISLADELARRMAVAIDNAIMHRNAQRAISAAS